MFAGVERGLGFTSPHIFPSCFTQEHFRTIIGTLITQQIITWILWIQILEYDLLTTEIYVTDISDFTFYKYEKDFFETALNQRINFFLHIPEITEVKYFSQTYSDPKNHLKRKIFVKIVINSFQSLSNFSKSSILSVAYILSCFQHVMSSIYFTHFSFLKFEKNYVF